MTRTNLIIAGPGEYRFTRADGSHAHELVCDDAGETIAAQVRAFSAMHRAVAAMPLAEPDGPILASIWRTLWERYS